MNWLRAFRSRLLAMFRKQRLDAEMNEELRSHIDMQTQEHIRAGMNPEGARYAAALQFGYTESVKETCREQRGVMWVDNLLRDLRFAARTLWKNPGFSSIAVLTLALGIGASSSVFSLIQGVLLTLPSYPKPEQLILIRTARADGQPYLGGPSTEQWTGWQKESKSFEAMAGYDWTFDYLLLQDGGEAVSGLEVTSDYFNVIGIKPLLGRAFLKSETPSNPQLATFIILGYDLWQKRYHGDPNILGQKVLLSRHETLTVVGVMPPGVRFLPSFGEEMNPNYDVNARVDYWLPVHPDLSKPKSGSGNGPWSVAARLRADVTTAQAKAELAVIAARQARADSDYQGITVQVQRLTEFLNHDGRRLLLPMLGAVALVLLIACGNVAGLLLVRGVQRQREYSIRCALGAPRKRLFQQVFIEALMISILAGALGVALTAATIKTFKAIGGSAIPRLDTVAISPPVLAFCLATSAFAAIFAGFLPALRASGLDPAHATKGSGPTHSAGRSQRRLLGAVAMLQTSLTVALLVGAGLLIRTVVNLARVRPGFDSENILTMSVMTDFDQKTQDNFHERALQRIAGLPGVKSAAFVWGLPLTGNHWANDAIKIEGELDKTKVADKAPVEMFSVTPAYFDTMGLRIVEGRGFRSDENASSWKLAPEPAAGEMPSVCLINQSMADKFFPNSNPLGKKLITWPWPKRPKEIIGIVANARTRALTDGASPEVYLPFFQFYVFTKHLVVRTASDPRLLAAAVQHELRAVDPTVAVNHVETMEEIRSASVATQTFAMRLLVGFSIVGSALALVGIYGVLALSVVSRKREIAIRMAVGAQKRTILNLVLSEGLKLILTGLMVGIVLAVSMTRALKAFLFGVGPSDPMTLVSVAIIFTSVALLACMLPALRSTRVDPMEAMRCE